MCLWCTLACKDGAAVAVALKEHPVLGRKGTCVKNCDQNGLRKVQMDRGAERGLWKLTTWRITSS